MSKRMRAMRAGCFIFLATILIGLMGCGGGASSSSSGGGSSGPSVAVTGAATMSLSDAAALGEETGGVNSLVISSTGGVASVNVSEGTVYAYEITGPSSIEATSITGTVTDGSYTIEGLDGSKKYVLMIVSRKENKFGKPVELIQRTIFDPTVASESSEAVNDNTTYDVANSFETDLYLDLYLGLLLEESQTTSVETTVLADFSTSGSDFIQSKVADRSFARVSKVQVSSSDTSDPDDFLDNAQNADDVVVTHGLNNPELSGLAKVARFEANKNGTSMTAQKALDAITELFVSFGEGPGEWFVKGFAEQFRSGVTVTAKKTAEAYVNALVINDFLEQNGKSPLDITTANIETALLAPFQEGGGCCVLY